MEFISNEDKIHTEQMQDVIGRPPRWLYRWGISLVFGIGLICVFVSSRINYPEVVQTRVKLVPLNSSHAVSVSDSGRLVKILVQNDHEVKKGDSLAVIERATDKTIINAPVGGKLTYAGIIRENQQLAPKQNVFYISSGNNGFYGEMIIPQNYIDKIKAGQVVIVKLSNSGDGDRGTLKGVIKYVTDNQLNNAGYVAEVDFKDIKKNGADGSELPANGVMAGAEIITVRATLLQRLIKSLTRGIK